MNYLGMLYYHGQGVILQPELGFDQFILAATCGDADACNNAGLCLERGIGAEKNLLEAMKYYRVGSERGSSSAMYNLGFLLAKRAIDMYALAYTSSYQANEKNKLTLRAFQERGIIPVDERGSSTLMNESEIVMQHGISWLRASMERGVVDAAYQLGYIMEQVLKHAPR